MNDIQKIVQDVIKESAFELKLIRDLSAANRHVDELELRIAEHDQVLNRLTALLTELRDAVSKRMQKEHPNGEEVIKLLRAYQAADKYLEESKEP
jgi:uncharacterized coiled-coil protein SlyX